MITMTQATNGPAYETESRGVDYYLYTDCLGRFVVASQRIALRAARMGGTVRHFKTLAEVETTVKAFRGLSALVAL